MKVRNLLPTSHNLSHHVAMFQLFTLKPKIHDNCIIRQHIIWCSGTHSIWGLWVRAWYGDNFPSCPIPHPQKKPKNSRPHPMTERKHPVPSQSRRKGSHPILLTSVHCQAPAIKWSIAILIPAHRDFFVLSNPRPVINSEIDSHPKKTSASTMSIISPVSLNPVQTKDLPWDELKLATTCTEVVRASLGCL